MTEIIRTSLLGVPLACLRMNEMLEWVDRAIAMRESHQVATANVNFLALARRDREFMRILQDASLVITDGMLLYWASWLKGTPVPQRVAGADLVSRLFESSARRGYRVFLMGAPGSTEETADRMRSSYPALRIAGTETPPYGPIESWDNAAYCRRMREAGADLLFVGFGAPKQDVWIARYLRDTGVSVAIGTGATFDYLAGRVRRAPRWLQAAGLEWAWRLSREPRRLWRRYLFDALQVGPALFGEVVRSRVTGSAGRAVGFRGAFDRYSLRRSRRKDPLQLTSQQIGGVTVLAPIGELTAATAATFVRQARVTVRSTASPLIAIDLSAVRRIDSSGYAALIVLLRHVERRGGDVCLSGLDHDARLLLEIMQLHLLFEVRDDVPAAVEQLTCPPATLDQHGA